MGEMDEFQDLMREAGRERERRKLSKKGIATVLGTLLVLGVLVGTYIAVAMNQDTYWKPKGTVERTNVNGLNENFVLWRTRDYYTEINETIGNARQNSKFTVEIAVVIQNYVYIPGDWVDFDIILLHLKVFGIRTENANGYQIKELIFKYEWSDKYLDTTTIHYYSLRAKNLYFLATKGEFDRWSYKIDYEWAELHQLRGINKDAEDIKEAGFGLEFQINLYDDYPNWTYHTVTLTATLLYGKHTIFGWQDVRIMSTEVKIEIVNGGGVR